MEGTRFYKPEERYGPGVQIACDRCQTSPISEGYGLGPNDICLPCVNKVIAYSYGYHGDLKMMKQEQFTRLWENQIIESRVGNSPLTFMEQGMFQKLNETGIEPFFNRPRQSEQSATDLQHRLNEMLLLREQPIPRLSDENSFMAHDDNGAVASSLDAQFGLLLPNQNQKSVELKKDNVIQTEIKDNNKPKQSVDNHTPSISRPNEKFMTRMMQGMYRTPKSFQN
jgi:hypothetical protein